MHMTSEIKSDTDTPVLSYSVIYVALILFQMTFLKLHPPLPSPPIPFIRPLQPLIPSVIESPKLSVVLDTSGYDGIV